jgi:hypothetical protein
MTGDEVASGMTGSVRMTGWRMIYKLTTNEVNMNLKTSFISGELSSKLQNRFDFDKYNSGAQWMENFNIGKEGNISFRSGSYFTFDLNIEVESLERQVKLMEWTYNDVKSYLLAFSDKRLRIFLNMNLIQTLTSPYSIADIKNIQADYIGSNFYIADGVHTLYVLNAVNDVFSLEPTDFVMPPFADENLTAATMQPSALSGDVTITCSLPIFTDVFIGMYIKIKDVVGGQYGFAKVTAVNSPTAASATVKKNFITAQARDDWTLSETPRGIFFYQSRLFLAKNDRIYASRTQSNDGIPRFDDFTVGANEEDAVSLQNTLFKTPILWLKANEKNLFAGTSTGLYYVNNSNSNGILSPVNLPNISRLSDSGSNSIPPLLENNSIFFVSNVGVQNNPGSRLNIMSWSWEMEGHVIDNANLLSEEINMEGIVDLAFLSNYDDLIYCLKNNGEITCLNYDYEQQIKGWTRMTSAEFNRRLGKYSRDGFVESLTSLRQPDGSHLLVLCVRREIEGKLKRYLEHIPLTPRNLNPMEYFSGDRSLDRKVYNYDIFQLQLNYNNLDCSSVYDGLRKNRIVLSQKTPGEAAAATTDYNFTKGDEGKFIREEFDYDNEDGIAQIIEFIDSNNVRLNIIKSFKELDNASFVISTQTIGSLDYLEGKTVGLWADGRVGLDREVRNGKITLEKQAFYVIAGLKYKGKLKTMNYNGLFNNNSSVAYKKQIVKADVYFYNSIGCKIGTDVYNLSRLDAGLPQDREKPPLLFNGLKTITFNDTPSEDKCIYLLKDECSPCAVQLINVEINYS